MKTITLETELNFIDALKYLVDGKCIGIKPGNNCSFLVKYNPTNKSKDLITYYLCWEKTVEDNKCNFEIRTDQFLGIWHPVVIDTNDLPEHIKQSFVLKNLN